MATKAAYFDQTEAAAPATPATAVVRTYAKTDGLMYSKDDAGVETLMSSGASMSNPMTTAGDVIYSSDGAGTPARLGVGSNGEVLTLAAGLPSWAAAAGGAVATDAIWDAAGDLAVGTGANTAAKLAIGSTGQVLTVAAGTAAWAAATGSSPLLAVQAYDNVTEAFWATLTAPTAIADFDATNAAVTFTAPASGNVIVKVFSPLVQTAALADVYLGIRESTTQLASHYRAHSGAVIEYSGSFYISGIAGGAHTYKFTGKASTGNLRLYGGNGASGGGIFIMEVWAAP